ncbi:hypothetical protein AAY473_010619, partial [Plecturocebus cupreus]
MAQSQLTMNSASRFKLVTASFTLPSSSRTDLPLHTQPPALQQPYLPATTAETSFFTICKKQLIALLHS